MLVSVKKRFIFVANSKTASTSIETILKPYAEFVAKGSPRAKHASWRDVESSLHPLFSRSDHSLELFVRFGVIREPADWVLSWYNYRRFRNNAGIPREMSFSEFWASDDWVKRKTQNEHFLDADGQCRFDLIIPMGKLRTALPQLYAAFGIDSAVDKVENKSKGTLSRSEVPQVLLDHINMYYRADFEMNQDWMMRFDTIFPDVLNKIRSNVLSPLAKVPNKIIKDFESMRAANNNTVISAKPSRIKVAITIESALDFEWLKILSSERAEDGQITVMGSMLPKQPRVMEAERLVLLSVAGETVVVSGLPSPVVAARFPGNVSAKDCRFKSSPVPLVADTPVTLWWIKSGGVRQLLATLSWPQPDR